MPASEERFRALFENSPMGMAIANADGVQLEANEVLAGLLGYARGDMAGMRIADFTHADDWPLERHFLGELFSGRRDAYRIEKRYWCKSGKPLWVRLQVTALPEAQGLSVCALGMVLDLTERRQYNTELRLAASTAESQEARLGKLNQDLGEYHQRLREMAAQNEATLEQERKHMALEVHDELGQVLTALRMNMSLLEMRLGAQLPALIDEMQGMKELVDRAIQGVRNVAGSLRPAALDMGLVSAIEWQCHEFSRHSGVACAFHARSGNIELEERRAVVVFRIVQESLTNICRYARASQVEVSLGRCGDELWVQVRDNGAGFDQDAAAKKKSFGLLGMRERTLTLGGRIDIDSAAGSGTVISVLIPIGLGEIGVGS
jgi:PAS domain S-box-containing protein